uniref:Bifunctional dihydrofolate synthase/folylpolyglutamate synthase (FolC) n=1 Tax=uncultured marine group II/III euryarchaeote AD1000_20_A10 TaxID=1457734 RepID=A0A075FLK9_9EURY|nr:bifunctional dihydrofolate synthase/folylpolyglutamate synthase (folC) [uncultured marine group II/III euryarchaeote AD1000_20_A10]
MSVRDWLDERLLMGVKLGLENCATLLSRLENPHLDFPSIHVAGSNGKGSACVQLSAAACANGLITGLFTSPHLVTVEERIRIDGRPISPEAFDRLLGSVMQAARTEPECTPTYFETTFLVAMLAFSEAGVERGIIETGMGGRLDATRLVGADLCILTTVSKEHSEYLGETLVEIAAEKAAIHRPGVPLIALQHDDFHVRELIERKVGRDLFWLPWPATGSTWSGYSAVVAAAGSHLGWQASAVDCVWPGRSPGYGENWVDGVTTRLSVAHNAESLANDLAEVTSPSVVLLGMSRKADLKATLEPVVSAFSEEGMFPRVVLTEPKSGRNPAVSVNELSEMMRSMGVSQSTTIERAPERAFEMAGGEAREIDAELLVIGSVYLVGDLLEYVAERNGLELWDELMAH